MPYNLDSTALNVHEMWVLLIDALHIVTFSTKQVRDRLSVRIDKAFISSMLYSDFRSRPNGKYNAATHALVCISGGRPRAPRSRTGWKFSRYSWAWCIEIFGPILVLRGRVFAVNLHHR